MGSSQEMIALNRVQWRPFAGLPGSLLQGYGVRPMAD